MDEAAIFKQEPDKGPRITRKQVADRLRVSVATVRRLEGSALHPEKNEKGVWTFSAAEVARVAQSRSKKRRVKREDEGDVAARVFELLEEGFDLNDIVIAVRQPPQTVRALYAEWTVSLAAGERKRQQEDFEKKLTKTYASI